MGALFHALFEFALQIPGPALLVTIAFGLAWNPPPTRSLPNQAGTPLRRSGWALGAAFLLLLLGGIGLFQAQGEARGRRAIAPVLEGKAPPDLVAELALRAKRLLEEADGSLLAREDVPFLTAQAH